MSETQSPDAEPFFVLQASDDCAAGVVMIWACLKNGDLAGALNEFNTLAQDVLPAYEDQPQEAQATAAVTVAELMEAWGE